VITFNFVEDLFQALSVAVLTVHFPVAIKSLRWLYHVCMSVGMLELVLCLNVVVGCFLRHNNI